MKMNLFQSPFGFGLLCICSGAGVGFVESFSRPKFGPLTPEQQGMALGTGIVQFMAFAVGLGLIGYHFLVYRRYIDDDDSARRE